MWRLMEWSGDTPEEVAHIIHDNQETYGNVVGLPGPGCDVAWWKRVAIELSQLGWAARPRPWHKGQERRLRYAMEREIR